MRRARSLCNTALLLFDLRQHNARSVRHKEPRRARLTFPAEACARQPIVSAARGGKQVYVVLGAARLALRASMPQWSEHAQARNDCCLRHAPWLHEAA